MKFHRSVGKTLNWQPSFFASSQFVNFLSITPNGRFSVMRSRFVLSTVFVCTVLSLLWAILTSATSFRLLQIGFLFQTSNKLFLKGFLVRTSPSGDDERFLKPGGESNSHCREKTRHLAEFLPTLHRKKYEDFSSVSSIFPIHTYRSIGTGKNEGRLDEQDVIGGRRENSDPHLGRSSSAATPQIGSISRDFSLSTDPFSLKRGPPPK